MKQQELFDPERTVPQPCPVPYCGSVRFPGQDKVVTCAHDLEREPVPRPKGCLNTYQPQHTEIPY